MRRSLLTAFMVLALSSCGSASDESTVPSPGTSDVDSGGELSEQSITLRDGREVTCVVYASYKSGGLSCDWNPSKR